MKQKVKEKQNKNRALSTWDSISYSDMCEARFESRRSENPIVVEEFSKAVGYVLVIIGRGSPATLGSAASRASQSLEAR